MKNIAIIPARGGSKRIPRKNIKEFLGKPIIAYSIEAAIESKLFDEVMVSTDNFSSFLSTSRVLSRIFVCTFFAKTPSLPEVHLSVCRGRQRSLLCFCFLYDAYLQKFWGHL